MLSLYFLFILYIFIFYFFIFFVYLIFWFSVVIKYAVSDFSYPIVQKTQEDITILFSSAAISTLICISTKEELQVSILLFRSSVYTSIVTMRNATIQLNDLWHRTSRLPSLCCSLASIWLRSDQLGNRLSPSAAWPGISQSCTKFSLARTSFLKFSLA